MFVFNNKKFQNPIEIIAAFNEKEFINAIVKIQNLKEKFYLTGYISYKAKEVFLNNKIKSKTPLLYFEVHKNYKNFNFENEIKTKTIKPPEIFIKENIEKREYFENIKKIKEYISKGTTYEVNYTYSNDVFYESDSYNLFLNLIKNQKTPYCAYISNKYQEILSFSPELFFEIKNKKIITKPMKGTVKREGNDEKEIEFLKNDIKNKAENTMIVDLIRNDLSKIEKTSNIKVEKLFEIETHKTLHQMTSTISADIEEIDFYDILSSIFPCGSITGAPKISTMEVIDKIENYKRGVYCGAIGYLYKDEALFSVPIRILEKSKDELKYTFSQGGAIVWRSDAADEYEECKTKRLFLGESIDFNLIETILIKNNTPQLYFEHLKRLKNSAKYFGFKFNDNLLNEKFKNNKIARILLNKSGEYEIQYKDIEAVLTNKIEISKQKLYSKNPFLYHKTTKRDWYKKAGEKILNNEIFDMIFLNEKDEVCEGSRTNIIIKKDNILYTPKINSGLLEGTLRNNLLDRNIIKEKTIYLNELINADNIFLINSIRGIIECHI